MHVNMCSWKCLVKLKIMPKLLSNLMHNCQIHHCSKFVKNNGQLLIVQCDAGDTDYNLIACTRHCIQQELQYTTDSSSFCVIFLIHVPRVMSNSFRGFQVIFSSLFHLIACTRHCIQQELQYTYDSSGFCAIFLIHVPCVMSNSFRGFQVIFSSLFHLIACTRHCMQQELQYTMDSRSFCVIFLIHVPNVMSNSFRGFQVCT